MPYVEIPWEWLLNDADRQSLEKEEVTAIEVQPLSLRFEEDKGMIAKWERITPKLEEYLTDQSFYMDGAINRTAFNQPLETLIEDSGKQLLIDKLFDTLKNVYRDPNREVHSLTFVSYERQQPHGEESFESLHLSLNTIGDTLSVESIPIEVRYDDNGSIKEVIVRSEQEESNTPRALSLDAYFDENTEPILTKLMTTIEETMLKHKNASNEKQLLRAVEQELDTQLDKVKDEKATLSSLETWINHAKGQYKSEIIGVHYSDEGAMPLTVYTIAVPNSESVQSFSITIDRSVNKITQINKEEE